MSELNGKEMGGSAIEVSLAKPPSDKKKKEEILRARERRMMQMMQVRGGCSPSHPSMLPSSMPMRGPGGPGPRGASGGGSMRGPMGRGDYGKLIVILLCILVHVLLFVSVCIDRFVLRSFKLMQHQEAWGRCGGVIWWLCLAQPFCCVHCNKNCVQDVLISKPEVVRAYGGYDVS